MAPTGNALAVRTKKGSKGQKATSAVKAFYLPKDSNLPVIVSVGIRKGRSKVLKNVDIKPYLDTTFKEVSDKGLLFDLDEEEGIKGLVLTNSDRFKGPNPVLLTMVGDDCTHSGPVLVLAYKDKDKLIDCDEFTMQSLCIETARAFLYQLADWKADIAYDVLDFPFEDLAELEKEVLSAEMSL